MLQSEFKMCDLEEKVLSGELLMASEQEFGKLVARVDGIAKTVDDMYEKFDHTLFGNGQKGLYEIVKENAFRVGNVSDQIAGVAEQVKNVSTELQEVSDLISAVTKGLQDHINDPKQTFRQNIIDNIKTIAVWFIVAFIVLHSILPTDFSLWSLIEKLIN